MMRYIYILYMYVCIRIHDMNSHDFCLTVHGSPGGFYGYVFILVKFPSARTTLGKRGRGASFIWANYNDLTTTSLEIMVSKGNHPQMTLIQVSELL